MWRQKSLPNPPLSPTPQFSTLSSPSPQVTCSMLVHTHMNEHGSGFTPTCVHTHLCVYTCAAVFIMCMSEGDHPPSTPHHYPTFHTSTPFAFQIYCNGTSLPSFAFAISCYGNKGTDWSGCSSESETQGEETERERHFFFACKS